VGQQLQDLHMYVVRELDGGVSWEKHVDLSRPVGASSLTCSVTWSAKLNYICSEINCEEVDFVCPVVHYCATSVISIRALLPHPPMIALEESEFRDAAKARLTEVLAELVGDWGENLFVQVSHPFLYVHERLHLGQMHSVWQFAYEGGLRARIDECELELECSVDSLGLVIKLARQYNGV